MGERASRRGCVYILTSFNSELIKIGGTSYAPMKRVREVNETEPYHSLGPWTLDHFVEVVDWRNVEYDMHYAFRSKLALRPAGQKELFRLAPATARDRLRAIGQGRVVRKPVLDRLFQDAEFSEFLIRLFASAGLLNWLNIQGAWTFSLFPSTGGGRYYTINIGPHEVAFAAFSRSNAPRPWHSIVVDKLIRDFPNVERWAKRHGGSLRGGVYASALPRAVSVSFAGSFVDASEFLALEGVRRALIAYWAESLTALHERGALSVFSRYHNWNAVAEIHSRARSRLA